MMAKKNQLIALLAVVLGGIVLVNLLKSDQAPAGVEARDAFRVMLCRTCQELEIATPASIRQRYDADQVGSGPGGTVFGCSSCGEVAANVLDVDLGSQDLTCPACGWEGPEDAGSVQGLIEGGKAQGTRNGQLRFHCPSCKEFRGELTSPAPENEE